MKILDFLVPIRIAGFENQNRLKDTKARHNYQIYNTEKNIKKLVFLTFFQIKLKIIFIK